MAIKVLLVDDHDLVRASFCALLERQRDIRIVGQTGDGQDAVEQAAQLCPDVVLMDVTLRGSAINGIQATQRITAACAEAKVIALSVNEELVYVKGMLAAGARGYLFKGCSEAELVDAIHSVVEGKTPFSEGARLAVQEDYLNIIQSPDQSPKARLTARELQVLEMVVAGYPSKGIAIDLNISRKTVDAHRHKIMEKLDIWSVAELTRYALREGVVVDED